MSRRMLYVALQVAARDKRITDQSWRGLDPGRKVELIAEEGGSRDVRLTAPVLVRRRKKLRESIAGATVLRRIRSLRTTASDTERSQITQEIDELRDALNAISKELRGR